MTRKPEVRKLGRDFLDDRGYDMKDELAAAMACGFAINVALLKQRFCSDPYEGFSISLDLCSSTKGGLN